MVSCLAQPHLRLLRSKLPQHFFAKKSLISKSGRTVAEDEAGGWAGKSEQKPGNMTVVLPPPWLFGQGMGKFPLSLSSLAVK